MEADVIVIGAGAAGLMAASELSGRGKKVVVLEARRRAGGRIHTIDDAAFEHPVEGGAEFVHGEAPLTNRLLQQAGLPTVPAGGSIWRSNGGRLQQQEDFIAHYDHLMQHLGTLREDMPVDHFLQTHLSQTHYADTRQTLQSYIEGYYAGDLNRCSTLALRDELQQGGDHDERVAGGYGGLVRHLQAQCKGRGCLFQFNTPVAAVHWQRGRVTVAIADGRNFAATRAIITIPVGVLQATGGLAFYPAIKDKMAAVRRLGFGGVIKMVLQFRNPFWQTDFALNDMAFLFSEQSIPTWWTQHPQQSNLLTGWCAGPQAAAQQHLTDAALLHKGVQSLAGCFGLPADAIENKLAGGRVFNWVADRYTGGGYSYLTVDSAAAINELSAPVEDTLFFAGEGLCNGMQIGTVEAALQSGQQVARQVAESF